MPLYDKQRTLLPQLTVCVLCASTAGETRRLTPVEQADALRNRSITATTLSVSVPRVTFLDSSQRYPTGPVSAGRKFN